MLTRPSHILVPPNADDPDFAARSAAWTSQMRSEMQETIALTKQTLTNSRALMNQIDRVLSRK